MKKPSVSPRLRQLPDRVAAFCSPVPVVLALFLFGYVALFSLTQTSIFNPDNLGGEEVLYDADGPVVSLLLTVMYGLLACLLSKFTPPSWRGWYDRAVTAVVVAATVGGGLWWVFTCQSIPAADSGTVYNTAMNAIAGDFTDFYTSNNPFYGHLSYYQLYPFQLGYVFLSEGVYRLCGADTAIPMQVVNVLALAALYAGLLRLARRLFDSRWAVTLLGVLLLGCLQPLFFCAFTYGNILGFAAGVWAACCAEAYMHSTHRLRLLWLAGCAALLCLAVLAKYNNMIWVLAIVIGLGLYVLRTHRWKLLPLLAVLLLLPVGAQKLVIVSYESRSGVELGDGVTQLMYLHDGLQESNMAPGWYNDRAKSMLVAAFGDTAAAEEQAKAALTERLEELAADPDYTAAFFRQKLLSQWNEPSYECLWVSQMKAHYTGAVEEGTALHSVYYGELNEGLSVWFNVYQSAVLLLLCVGLAGLLRRRVSPTMAMLAALPLGGALYHLLFEAKSQYCLTYFIMLVFFAGYGLCRLAEHFTKKEGLAR